MNILPKIVPRDFNKFYTQEGLRIAVLGMSGSGKSFLGKSLVEDLVGMFRIVVIDPEGEWQALKAIEETLVVGLQDDVPIKMETFPDYMATNMNLVFNLNGLPYTKHPTYIAKIVKEVFDYSKPCMLVVEEAHLAAPQSINSINGKKADIIASLNTMVQIAKRGRKRGIGMVLMTQRPADINKSVLSQTNRRFFGKFIEKSDLEAIKDYLRSANLNFKQISSLSNGYFYAYDGKSASMLKSPGLSMPDLGSATHIKFEPLTTKKITETIKELEKVVTAIPDDLEEEERIRLELDFAKKRIQILTDKLKKYQGSDMEKLVEENSRLQSDLALTKQKLYKMGQIVQKYKKGMEIVKRVTSAEN